ncbi:MAG: phosphatidylinositol kinase [Bradymonadales bacterium]|nr:MAG: phosphatidylinositol kinase [Bradymonadales bacterium]
MNRKGKVYFDNLLAGIIEQNDEGYIFSYDEPYLKDEASKPISLTMPLRNESYRSKTLFPFFDGLIPEGWLLDVAIDNWKLNPRDRMGLLLAVCGDCIGAVHIEEIKE